ncbi:MAG: SDR family NAD(P)-dependent oxidoreductase [Acidiferrobacterales bacterium]|nr:SDR family NAD(P)-dependent oxidoreductase [Acidiferrobacterales bacterium]
MDSENTLVADNGAIPSRQNDIAIVIGASGGIGSAICRQLLSDASLGRVVAVSRSEASSDFPLNGDRPVIWYQTDHSEFSIEQICGSIAELKQSVSQIYIATGTLHGKDYSPEKRIESLEENTMQQIFQINTIIPALWLKTLTGLFSKNSDCVITVLSARIGSISDNRSGGWYSYRASKAALNMILKTTAIEYTRRFPKIKLNAFHPGTTDTALSKPFQSSVPAEKLFTPDYVAKRLMRVVNKPFEQCNIRFIDWAGEEVIW